jgi:hypothetical protein
LVAPPKTAVQNDAKDINSGADLAVASDRITSTLYLIREGGVKGGNEWLYMRFVVEVCILTHGYACKKIKMGESGE